MELELSVSSLFAALSRLAPWFYICVREACKRVDKDRRGRTPQGGPGQARTERDQGANFNKSKLRQAALT